MSNLELRALADAVEQWPQQTEVWGTAHDATHDALVHGKTVNGSMRFDEPVVLERHVGPVETRSTVTL